MPNTGSYFQRIINSCNWSWSKESIAKHYATWFPTDSITIKLANESTRTISRLEIEVLRNSNVSFMPEELEATITQQDLSDLIAFLQSPVVDTKP